MRAGLAFVEAVTDAGMRPLVTRFVCRLHGSLAATGVGHGTPDAVIAGLRGHRPETVDPALVHGEWARLHAGETLAIGAGPLAVPMVDADIEFAPREREYGHPNAMTLTAYAGARVLAAETYLSVGGGFIRRVGSDDARGRRFDREVAGSAPRSPANSRTKWRPREDGVGARVSRYRMMQELIDELDGRTIAELAWQDEVALQGAGAAASGIDAIWRAMRECVESGLRAEGVLPGRLQVPRRAAAAWRALSATGDPAETPEALSIYAMAVNE